MSIRLKLTAFLAALALLLLGAMGTVSYTFSRQIALREAQSKARLLSGYTKAQQMFIKEKQRPLLKTLLESDRFYPELHSGFAILRHTADMFHTRPENDGFRLRQASIDPFVESNQATADEAEIIKKFQQDPKLTVAEGVLKVDGKETFYVAQTVRVDKKCLECHGVPDDAPKDIQELYGTKAGYNWKVGDAPGAFIFYVPVQRAMAAAVTNTWKIFGLGAALLFVLVGALWFYLGRAVFAPLRRLTESVEKISMGQDIEVKLDATRKDEIGTLSKAIDRLRISVIKLIGSE